MNEKPPDEPRDPIELAEELFGSKVAKKMRELRDLAKPTHMEVDPVTGHRIYSHSDD